jgi:hypothetical protein
MRILPPRQVQHRNSKSAPNLVSGVGFALRRTTTYTVQSRLPWQASTLPSGHALKGTHRPHRSKPPTVGLKRLMSLYLHDQVVFEDTITRPNLKTILELDSSAADFKKQVV